MCIRLGVTAHTHRAALCSWTCIHTAGVGWRSCGGCGFWWLCGICVAGCNGSRNNTNGVLGCGSSERQCACVVCVFALGCWHVLAAIITPTVATACRPTGQQVLLTCPPHTHCSIEVICTVQQGLIGFAMACIVCEHTLDFSRGVACACYMRTQMYIQQLCM